MSKRRTKIPTPTWEHEQTGITRKLEANRWQLWATVGIVLLVAASLGVVGWAFLSDYIEDQQRPGSLGLRVADRELTVEQYTERANLLVQQFGSADPRIVLPTLSRELIQESLLLQFADERSVTASEDEVRAQIASRLGIEADDPNFDARLEEELTRTGLSEEQYTDLARGDVLAVSMLASFQSEVPDSLPSVNYRQIELEDQATADDLVAQLDEGADFATLAAQSPDTVSAAAGGERGWVPEGVLDGPAESVLFSLEVNEITTFLSNSAVFIYEVLEKSDSQEVADEHRTALGGAAFREWLTEKEESVEIVDEMDLQTGDGDKIGYIIDHANLSVN